MRDRYSASDVEQMIEVIESEVQYTRDLIGKAALAPNVMAAMRQAPREEFVEEEMKRLAYADGPLPIGRGQTISQPYIVALMTDLIEPKESFTVLEVGTGSGYQAAVLSRLVTQVYSIEIIEELANEARTRLRRLHCDNVEVRVGDGYFGWQEHASFDGIIVTAAAEFVPPPLVEQLKPGARLVIPIGQTHSYQRLKVFEKDLTGHTSVRDLMGVAFVPLTGDHNATPGVPDPDGN